MNTFSSVLTEHIELTILAILILVFIALCQFLKQKYGTTRKRHYKNAWFELMVGILLIYYWRVLEGECLIWGLPGIMSLLYGTRLLLKFAPKKDPNDDTSFR